MALPLFYLSVSGPGQAKEVEIGPQGLTIGRETDNELCLASPNISRRHAVLLAVSTGCQAVDLDSSNGTLLNGEKLAPNQPAQLADGDVLRVGPFTLTFHQGPSPSRPNPTESGAESGSGPAASEPETGRPSPPPAGPPPVAPPPAGPNEAGQGDIDSISGIFLANRRLLDHLPEAYATDFMQRFLALFESILLPIEWTIDNFDLFLDYRTAPAPFLAWLTAWYSAPLEMALEEAPCREFLKDASQIYARRGTPWGLSRILEIATGKTPEIIDSAADLPPYTFRVRLPFRRDEVNLSRLESLIAANKPAGALFELEFEEVWQ